MDQTQTPLHYELLIAGFGGQGVLKMGQTLAEAAMLEGREVVWTPAYGPEMRGGPANCAVIISSTPIGSPVVSRVNAAIIMDRPSVLKFQGQVRPDGLLLVNSTLVDPALVTADARCYAIPVSRFAEELGEASIANMVMLGAFIALTRLVATESIIQALSQTLPAHRRHLIPLNEQALLAGATAVTP